MGPCYDAISLMVERLPEPDRTPAARYRGLRSATPPAAARRRFLTILRRALRDLVASPLRLQRRYARP